MAKGKPYQTIEELLEDAKKQLAEIAEDGIKQTNWDELVFMTDVRIADFVEQRFIGMNENFIQMEHDINAAERRLENMEESPRKKAAQTVLDLYRQSYLEATELAYMSKVYSHAQTMTITEPYKSRVNLDMISRRDRLVGANGIKYLEKKEELSIYQNMMSTFFMDNAILRQTEEGQIDKDREKVQNAVLKKIGDKLPAGAEYDVYRTMEGYEGKQAEVLVPEAAELIMNSNVLTDVTVDSFPARIRKENPKRLDIEWGVSTFDNMMDALYSKDELKAMKKDNKNFLDTVFFDGKPALSVLPKQKDGESRDGYLNRMKCEVVAYALEGKARMDIAPFAKTNDGYDFKKPIPVHVKVNLKEEVSAWRRFKNFLGIKPRETKKEIAERISLTELGKEDHHREIQAYIREKVEMEKHHQLMKRSKEKTLESVIQADQDFFGKTAKDMGKICMVTMSQETANALKISDKEFQRIKDTKVGSVSMMKTLYRIESRVALCRLFAMTQGMTIEEIMSEDPSLKARKEEIGKAFINKVSVMSEQEYLKKNGKDADYEKYFRERQNDICDTLGDMMRCVGDQPLDFFRDPNPEKLAEDYQKGSFFTQVTQDLFQCCPLHVKNLNYKEMEALEVSMRCIGEMVHVTKYCENYLASESCVNPNFTNSNEKSKVINGATERAIMDKFLDDTRNVTSLMKLRDITNSDWAKSMLTLKEDVYSKVSDDPEFVAMSSRYAQTGKNPIVFFNKETKEYTIDKSDVIYGLSKAEKRGNLKELMTFEEISMNDIQESRRKHMTPREKKKMEKQEIKELLKNKMLT